MSPDVASDLIRNAIILVVKIVCVLAIPGLIVGVFISIFQAATQINEQSLSILPRLIVTMITLAVITQWLIREIEDYFLQLMNRLPELISFP